MVKNPALLGGIFCFEGWFFFFCAGTLRRWPAVGGGRAGCRRDTGVVLWRVRCPIAMPSSKLNHALGEGMCLVISLFVIYLLGKR